jgi:hypothetical protein
MFVNYNLKIEPQIGLCNEIPKAKSLIENDMY